MFNIRLKELRENKRLSQQQLAKALGVAQGTVGNWESGIREPNFDTAKRIAAFFGVTVSYLLGDSEKQTLDEELKGIDFALLDGTKRLTKKKKEALLSYLRFLEQEEEKEE